LEPNPFDHAEHVTNFFRAFADIAHRPRDFGYHLLTTIRDGSYEMDPTPRRPALSCPALEVHQGGLR
jgi:hypothetical protein